MRLIQSQLHLRAALSPLLQRVGLFLLTPSSKVANSGQRTHVEGLRYASVKAQGAYKLKNKKTLPKKLGAKRVGDQYVLPGTILYKQRGTIWHAGENALMGRDHTIHAAFAGFVKYYRDRERHPDRQYIGVAFNRNDVLPYPVDAARKRRLGMTFVTRKSGPEFEPTSKSGIPRKVIRKTGGANLVNPDDTGASRIEVSFAQVPEEELDSETNLHGSKHKETRASFSARRWNEHVRAKRSNRVLFLGKSYGYQESNVQIGRLMGKHKGKTAGTQRYGSRRSMFRHRRKKREEIFQGKRDLAQQQRNLASSGE